MIDTIHSPEALANPYGNKVTLSREFLNIPLLQAVITDTHFAKRDGMGRLLVFLARILQDRWAKRARAIAVEENAAVLIDPDGRGTVVGFGPAYFLEADTPPTICTEHIPLTFTGISVHSAEPGSTFNVRDWKGHGGNDYSLSVNVGQVTGEGSPHGIY
jgi:cyanophycinase-like exopeptidase